MSACFRNTLKRLNRLGLLLQDLRPTNMVYRRSESMTFGIAYFFGGNFGFSRDSKQI